MHLEICVSSRSRSRRSSSRPTRSYVLHTLRQNINLNGGVAPVRAYIPALLADVLAGRLDPSPVLDLTLCLDEAPEGYKAMVAV
jgi:threonine dehydrogenase-like Zn-dependent dehydrogenase